MKRPTLALLAALSPMACSSDPAPQEVDSGVPMLDGGTSRLGLSPSVAYEGQRRFVAQLSSALGADDLSQATVTPEDPRSGIVIDQTVCTRLRCAIVAHVDDVIPDRGVAVPAAIDGRRYNLVTRGRLYQYTSTMTVVPLDRADARTNAAGRVAPLAVYASLEIPAGVTLRPAEGDRPSRVVVFGGAVVRGGIDLSPDGENAPTGGGGAGGATPDGAGGAMGGGGHAAAGGGGGFAEAGAAGTGADGMAAGAGGVARGDRALWPLVGGAGGGGSMTGAGGAAGGTLLLVGFSGLDVEGATFTARGADGRGTGGGGSGGGVFLAATTITGRARVDVTGGRGGSAGGATGGAGARGRVRVDGAAPGLTATGGPAAAGPAFDVDAIPPVLRSREVALRGRGTPGARVRVEDRYAARPPNPTVTATVGPDGTWTATLTLPAQGNPARLVLTETLPGRTDAVPSFSGTTLITRVEGTMLELEGAALDVVFLPMTD